MNWNCFLFVHKLGKIKLKICLTKKISCIQVESELEIAKPKNNLAIKEDSLEAVLTSNLLLLFLLGYEQTSSVMAACMFFLARDPHIQEQTLRSVK